MSKIAKSLRTLFLLPSLAACGGNVTAAINVGGIEVPVPTKYEDGPACQRDAQAAFRASAEAQRLYQERLRQRAGSAVPGFRVYIVCNNEGGYSHATINPRAALQKSFTISD